MTEEELEMFLQSQGWNLFVRARRGGRRQYLYANRWRAGEIYIAPRLQLSHITREAILEKIGGKIKTAYH